MIVTLPQRLASDATFRRKCAVLAVTALSIAWLLMVNGTSVFKAAGPFREMQQFDRDEASTAYGVWLMWSTPTIDFEEPMKTGLFHSLALVLGALAAPFHPPSVAHFAVAARIAALLLACLTLLASAWVIGSVSNWSWAAALAPLYLAMSAQFNYHATEIRVEMAMFLFEVLALWAMSRFLVEPGRRWFKWTMVLITLSFSGKPSVLPMYFLFMGVNLYQVLRDGQQIWPEFRWRALRGALYFFVTLLLATPNSFFSFGLFVASLRSEMDASSKKLEGTPFWEWLRFLLEPWYLGIGPTIAVTVLVAVFLVHAWRIRRTGRSGTRDPLAAFVWISLAWTLLFWVFILVKSRSYILRYLDPGWITFVVLGAALVAYLLREHRRLGWAAMAVVILAALHTVPAQRAAHARHLARFDEYPRIMAAKRAIQRELEALIPAGTPFLSSPDVLLEDERFPGASRYFRYQPRYFEIQPQYLIATRKRLYYLDEFLSEEVSWRNRYAVERKATAVFHKALRENKVWGTVELVRAWESDGVYLYRFKVPTDDAYVRWLTARIYAEVGVSPPKH